MIVIENRYPELVWGVDLVPGQRPDQLCVGDGVRLTEAVIREHFEVILGGFTDLARVACQSEFQIESTHLIFLLLGKGLSPSICGARVAVQQILDS